jgi:hypothetical protein
MSRFLTSSVILSALAVASSRGQDRPLPGNLGNDWLQYSETHTSAYHTPGWLRLILSIRPWGEVGSTHARLKLETNQATIKGGFLDNERFSYSKLLPEAYGIGFSGGVTF